MKKRIFKNIKWIIKCENKKFNPFNVDLDSLGIIKKAPNIGDWFRGSFCVVSQMVLLCGLQQINK